MSTPWYNPNPVPQPTPSGGMQLGLPSSNPSIPGSSPSFLPPPTNQPQIPSWMQQPSSFPSQPSQPSIPSWMQQPSSFPSQPPPTSFPSQPSQPSIPSWMQQPSQQPPSSQTVQVERKTPGIPNWLQTQNPEVASIPTDWGTISSINSPYVPPTPNYDIIEMPRVPIDQQKPVKPITVFQPPVALPKKDILPVSLDFEKMNPLKLSSIAPSVTILDAYLTKPTTTELPMKNFDEDMKAFLEIQHRAIDTMYEARNAEDRYRFEYETMKRKYPQHFNKIVHDVIKEHRSYIPKPKHDYRRTVNVCPPQVSAQRVIPTSPNVSTSVFSPPIHIRTPEEDMSKSIIHRQNEELEEAELADAIAKIQLSEESEINTLKQEIIEAIKLEDKEKIRSLANNKSFYQAYDRLTDSEHNKFNQLMFIQEVVPYRQDEPMENFLNLALRFPDGQKIKTLVSKKLTLLEFYAYIKQKIYKTDKDLNIKTIGHMPMVPIPNANTLEDYGIKTNTIITMGVQ